MIICNNYRMYQITELLYTDKGTFNIPLNKGL